ncbi:MAG: efflux RND transporter periplasmic adaptor subunit [Marinicaulis sp.]|nr:efflux RND transporter periplasmic adaptor subunit [Marinicaulis sp.]NNE41533.1 efflux RND transporter periplasmic adaptor subunit [Marinicaulis sp.]NNL89696.1 efflux RND transporter periplasmic adaptor subunit [Marinicaulis sp.]
MNFSRTLALGAVIGLVIGGAGVGFVLTQTGGDQASTARGEGSPGGGRGRGGYAPVVEMATVDPSAIERKIDVIGEARALRSVAITSEATGLIEEISFAPGARVEKGDLLLQIVDEEEQVALARARAEFPIAKANAERFKDLRSDAAASAQESEQAQNEFISAQAQLRSAEVAVAQRKILAPFDGIAGLTQFDVGDYIRAGDVVTTLDDTSSIIIEFTVPQEVAQYVNIGQPVRAALTSAAAKYYDGVVTAIDSRVNPESRTLRAEAIFENSEGRLIPGAVFAVSTTSEGEPALSVPGLAVQWDRSGAFVWRRNSEGSAERVSIIILQRNNEDVLVDSELKPGEAIVSAGADRVRSGVPLPQPANYGGAAQVSTEK